MSDPLEERVAEFIELSEAGAGVSAAEFAARHPEVELRLLESLARLKSTEDLFPVPSAIPRVIGPWVCEREIGRGGMGRVFLVHRRGDPDRHKFALKVLNPALTFDARSIGRIQREGEILEQLDHPGLVRVEEINGDKNAPWIAMEYVEGLALSELLAKARAEESAAPLALPSRTALEGADAWRALAAFGARIAEAAAEAHGAGLVHRDIKPSNVILRHDGAPVLIDFGLAATDSGATLTRTGDLLGTPQYMAPEQARGERADARTDIWSLGAALYECATLRPPVPETEPLAIIEWLRTSRPARLTGQSSVPPSVAQVIDRALSFRPSRRFESMHEFADHLRRAADTKTADTAFRSTPLLERIEDRIRAAPRFVLAALAAALLLVMGWSIALITAADEAADASSTVGEATSTASVAQSWLTKGTLAYLARDRGEWSRCADEAEAASSPNSITAQRAGVLRGVRDPERLPDRFADAECAGLADGIRAFRAHDHTAAIAAFRSAAQRTDDWTLPLVLLGEAARDADQLELCEREWTAAVRALPTSPHLFRRLGKVRRQRGDLASAIDAFRRAAEMAPEDWRNTAELARALVASAQPGAQREALAAVDCAIELCDSPSPGLLNVKAAILDTEGSREDARKIYRALIARDKDHFWSHFNLGYSFSLDCMLSESRLAYEEAVRVRPGSVEAQFALAHLALGADARSCERCEAAIRRDDELLDADRALHHLTLALRAGGRKVDWLPGAAAELALRMERADEVAGVLDDVLSESDAIDEGTVRLERALRLLR